MRWFQALKVLTIFVRWAYHFQKGWRFLYIPLSFPLLSSHLVADSADSSHLLNQLHVVQKQRRVFQSAAGFVPGTPRARGMNSSDARNEGTSGGPLIKHTMSTMSSSRLGWLVVYPTPLKNMKVSWGCYSQYMGK